MDNQAIHNDIEALGREMREGFASLNERTARVETLIETDAARCPYREEISKAANNKRRLASVEEKLTNVRIKVAGIAVLSGGGGGALAAAVVAKLMGG